MCIVLCVEENAVKDNSQVELAALKKLDDSAFEECNFEEKERKCDEDTQDAKNLPVLKEKDAEMEEKALVKDNHDDEKKSITEEDGAVIVEAQISVAAASEPVTLEYSTK